MTTLAPYKLSDIKLGHPKAQHMFLRMEQPVRPEAFPIPYVLSAGQSYDLEFSFYVPEQMSSRACTHPVCDDAVRQSHLQLPPSLGESCVGDDMSPTNLSISYDVVACVHGKEGVLMKESANVRVVPNTRAEPPLHFKENFDHQMHGEIKLRKGIARRTYGILTAEAVAPEPINFQDLCEHPGANITNAAVVLRFDGLEDFAMPPYLGCLKTRLLVANFSATSARDKLPTTSNTIPGSGQGTYVASVRLAPIVHEKAVWRKVPFNPSAARLDMKRHDSVGSMLSLSSRQSSEALEPKDLASYVLKVDVPIALPGSKVFIPTFHSCLGSRTYTLQILLEIGGGSTMELRVPVQIYNER